MPKNSNTDPKPQCVQTDVSRSVFIAKFMGLIPIKGISEHSGKEYYYYNNAEMQDYEALPDYKGYKELMEVVEKIMTLQFEDGYYYHLRTFGLRCKETNEFMVRFDRHQLFYSDSLFDALYSAVVDCLQGLSETDC